MLSHHLNAPFFVSPLLQTQEIQTTTVHLTEPQRALLGYISAGQEAISRAEKELTTKVSFYFVLTKSLITKY